ncbi:S8 family peptidase [Portibacter lacus]|uniref:Peptidase S8 n=1 Tax=Portibacter lacus TaxID=1099794 RepID=A0AA37WD09_9BACT|nr:S8 family peptidase [Portibacter lacus]GLR16333.1 peptidase S8 [Portibacter lacus]
MKFIKLFALILITQNLVGQGQPSTDWFHMDPTSSVVPGIATDKTYETVLKDKPSQTVIVAIIDSGVDVEHEDLKDIVWVNENEIPDNGIDDDKNGYIDDIHGWNFIGGANGVNVGPDTYEVTRMYKKYKYRYDDADPEKLNKKQKEEYKLFLEFKEEVESKKASAENNYNKILENETLLIGAINALKSELKGKAITIENIRAIESVDQSVMIGKSISENFIVSGDTLENFSPIEDEINTQLKAAKDHYKNQMDFAYNTDFDSRKIVGDNYADQREQFYGNNDVEGPDAFHGTHVAGIVAASRNNDIGINGIADNVRIMSVRTVPDGDERDKDVANAIRYAVDNGASIINMSFGKGYSWDKSVVDDAVRYARKNDVLLVHAAGNSSQNNDITDNFPNNTYEKKKLFGKKEADNWLEVGALNWQTGENLAAPFSNYGKSEVDVFAPGMAIYSTTPNNEYQNAQGTSMASPVVAGVAAVLRSYFPELSASQVKEIIMKSSVPQNIKVRKPGSDEMVNFSDLSQTGGIVNLEKAVELAQKTKGKKKIKKSKKMNNSKA